MCLSKNFILPVSHDEVVHGKLSLIDKMFGSYENKFKGIRLFLAHMMAHPGKKLMFMGSEYGQFREWDYENQLEWFMLDFDTHRQLKDYSAALNHFYLENDPLWYDDFSWDGFRWLIADEANLNLLAYQRIGKDGNTMICLFNFSGAPVSSYPIELPDESHGKNKKWECVFFSEDKQFGGDAPIPDPLVFTENRSTFSLPPLSAAFYMCKKGKKDVEI